MNKLHIYLKIFYNYLKNNTHVIINLKKLNKKRVNIS